jgi:hypothetical protein
MNGMQFKITLRDIKPPIWRRIIVPEIYSFWDLHVAIQDSFGWLDCHLHAFELKDTARTQIGIPDPDGGDLTEMKPGWKIKLKKHFTKEGIKLKYLYDFGDGWEHDVEFEGIVDKETWAPVCVEGKRACPPEDCGGIGGYEDFCRIMKAKKGNEYREMKEWYGEDYDPEKFDADKVKFDDSQTRLEQMQEG